MKSISLRLTPVFPIVLLVGAAGCGRNLDNISAAADSARNASEQIAERADAANRDREAKVLADAENMIEKTKAPTDVPNGSAPRYEIRKDNVGDSWTVYDTANGRAVRVDAKTQAGLSHDDAEAALGKLVKEQKEQDQLFGRVQP
jgi:hypothetical protein